MAGLYSYIVHGGPDPEWYSCTNHTMAYWYAQGIRRPYFAVYFYLTATVMITIYASCLIGMVTSGLIKKHGCYKIMFTMGFFDISSIVVNSYITGYLCFVGGVFCTHPRLVYLGGSIGVGLWSGSCVLVILLALNRFSELSQTWILVQIFQGNRIYLTLTLPFLWGSFMSLLSPAGMFTSKQLAWFFDPFNGSGKDYTNLPHTVNNCIVAILATVAYINICCKMAKKSSFSRQAFGKVQRQLFLQATLICSIHAIASYGYVMMNFWKGFPVQLIMVGHVAWQWSNGSPGIVYFCMNQRLRLAVFHIFGFRSKSIHSTRTHSYSNCSREPEEKESPSNNKEAVLIGAERKINGKWTWTDEAPFDFENWFNLANPTTATGNCITLNAANVNGNANANASERINESSDWKIASE
ncbi:unnamed protein product, partial [Mesorhabditis belari]|uniref:Uncharacterized protein n=1 Tax=Mesorhabditis belari TaxID=2138241 RepID=A0AAF3F3G4_9BILA